MTASHPPLRRICALLAAAVLLSALPATTLATPAHPNPPQAYVTLTAAAGAGRVVPLINSGQFFDKTTFEGIPDGLGIVPVGQGKTHIDIYVAFEQSHVPFGGFADFEDSSVQRARLDLRTMQLTKLEEVLPPDAGFIRLCSAFMAGPAQGFSNYTFFVNEESNDIIDLTAGATYGADPAVAPYRQAGYSVYLDTKTGTYDEIAGMGRHNHENTVVVPGGWDEIAIVSSDDTFSAPSSQLYLYTAANESAVKADQGSLWAFRVTRTNVGDPAIDPANAFNDANDYLEIDVGDVWAGQFIPVPPDIARGTTGVAPQTALQEWSDANNVFQFVRLEDIAYDPDEPRAVYITDTGTDRLAESDVTGRLFRGPSGTGTATNGRVFKFVLNPNDPTVVDAFSILVDALQIPAAQGGPMRNPDNLDVGHNSIMVQEDTGSAKVWRYDMSGSLAGWSHVASTVQPSAETSGIVDVSSWLGPGWWALDVQSHVNLPGAQGPFTYVTPITGVELQYMTRREDGQLLLMHIPGS